MYSVERTKGINFFKSFDYILFISVMILSAIGLIVLSSATKTMDNGNTYMIKQIVGLGIGVVLVFAITSIDYKDFKIIGIILYIISIVLLIYVYLKGTGKQQWGSNSWIALPFFSFQPSEIAKITFIIVISTFMERIREGQGKKNILKLLIYSSIPIGLVLLQPDFGTAMVFIFILFAMVFICGMPYKYFLGTFLLSIPVAAFTWLYLLGEKRKARILDFINPALADPLGSGMQVKRSIRAIGSGELYGKGLYHGLQTQRGTVPVKESDFIFTVIGEELGFIGAAIIIVLMFFIIFRCIYIAKNSRDFFGSFLVVGLTAMMGFHIIENIGMCIGLLPVTGIPLPFISSGGSSMITNFIAIGIIMSVSIRRKRTIFNSSQ